MSYSGLVYLGMDVGSVSINSVVIDENKSVIEEHYTRILGEPLKTAKNILSAILSRFPFSRIKGISLTGSGGKLLAGLIGASFVNEIIAQSKAMENFLPRVKTVIEMGGEDSKLIFLDFDRVQKKIKIVDFSMNTVCAAGTGSFLDQQATRLGLTVEDFGKLALESKNPPRIAGRCSVFAKTDMIHLQQNATPVYDIVAGLCYAMARNFKSTIGKGKFFCPPVSFQGGVAANLGMRRAFMEVLELQKKDFVIPRYFASLGAIGAVFYTRENPESNIKFPGLSLLENYLSSSHEEKGRWQPLSLSDRHQKKGGGGDFHLTGGDKIDAYLGLDIGSISTNVVVIDKEKKVLSKSYLMTAGRPIEAIKQGLKEVGEKVGENVRILAAGTTGSGRYLTGDFVGADVVRNEITAQARASLVIDPEVDTIFEIGGQDSKYISLENSVVIDFEMNKACAAGTGSFLEEQAERLNISIKEEFGKLALESKNPAPLGERCTVFMGSDLVHYQQQGFCKEDLVAGLSYSIVENYLHKVVEGRKIGEHILFQGGTAANQGVVAAFEKILGKEIIVPEHHEVTGAVGAAILAMEEHKKGPSKFKGFDLIEKSYELESFECQDCPNKCEIKKLEVEGESPLFYGSRCGKYDEGQKETKGSHLPDLFREREEILLNSCFGNEQLPETAPQIGIPRILFFYELLPLWQTFFSTLGFKVVLSDKTQKKIIHQGIESVLAETCFPIKIANGHILNLLQKGVKKVFLPSMISMASIHPEVKDSSVCPYVQSLPYTIYSAIDFEKWGARLIKPVVHLDRGVKSLEKSLIGLSKELGRRPAEIRRAVNFAFKAQADFYNTLEKRGKEILDNLGPSDKAFVLVSRPYNGCDSGMNLNLPRKMRDLGVLAIPLDYLSLEELPLQKEWQAMYWKYGQKILGAAHIIKNDKRLFGIYLTSFGCGPDSFISHFFKEKMGNKPFLQIEVDEHSVDVGAITRLEAFLDSLQNIPKNKFIPSPKKKRAPQVVSGKRTIYIPGMADHALAIAAAFEASGIPSLVMPESDDDTLMWGRKFTSGRECYPFILTTGDLVKLVKSSDFDPRKSAFFMPTGQGPCRFGQYHRSHRMVLDNLGYPEVPIYAPNQDETLYRQLEGTVNHGNGFVPLAWQGIVAIDLLEKRLRETRPYEIRKKACDEIYQHYLEEVCRAIKNKKSIMKVMERAKYDFDDVQTIKERRKPVVGIVGEIYIRSNRFGNENIVREIEGLGGEIWLPPLSEWIFYINFTSKRQSLINRNYRSYFKTFLTERAQISLEHKLEKNFRGSFRNYPEPTTHDILKKAEKYLDSSFEGEAILSIGKAVDFAEKGVCGIINVMPFNCMPGTIVNVLLKRYRENQNNIPALNLSFDGQKELNTITRLEAYMYQVHQYQEHGAS